MPRNAPLLEQIRIASPCGAAWDRMDGDDQVRFCAQCRKNVYDLSAMSRAEAEALVREREGKLCVRFYRRRDGTVLTDNCPVGLRRARRWLVTQIAGVAGVFGFLAVLAPLVRAEPIRRSETFQRLRHSRLAQVEPFRSTFEWIDPSPPTLRMGDIMGAMVLPPAPKP